MEKKDGMVAVVQALRDSNLAVTLLDGGKQYTLMPNDHAPQANPVPLRCRPSVNCASQYTSDESSGPVVGSSRENGIQATDGSYASTYKMMHCNLSPTSPPPTLTEFPPQRREVVHGHGNFVVGGFGSGETAKATVKSNTFRGGMVWPDKGSVCASRASVQSDAFANSLRKYPIITPERSTEIVQRLISFTQAKNSSRNQSRCPCSPTRHSIDSECSKQTFILEHKSSKNTVMGRSMYKPEVNVDNKKYRDNENSSQRKRSDSFLLDENEDSWNRPLFCKNNDVRCFRDAARKIKQGFRNVVGAQHTSQFNKTSVSRTKDQYDYEVYQSKIYEQESKNSVNMEIQATAQKESKEILTLPRIVPMQRTVATPLSPIPSKIEGGIQKEIKYGLNSCLQLRTVNSCKSVQVKLPKDVDIISSNSFDLLYNKYKCKNNKRSRSEEELGNIKKTNTHDNVCIQQESQNTFDIDEKFIHVKSPVRKMKRICQNCKHIFDDFNVLRRSFSNNTYFRKGFQFNINQQHTSNNFGKISSDDFTDGNNRSRKCKYDNPLQHNLENTSELLSHLDTVNNNVMISDPHIKDVARFSKAINESHSNNYGCTTEGLNNKLLAEEICHRKDNCNSSRTQKGYFHFGDEVNCNSKILAMTQEEIRNLIDLDILAFTEKYQINITTESLFNLIEELFDLFITNLNNTLCPSKTYMTDKIKNILQSRGLSEFQSMYLTNILTEHWEEEFSTTNNLKLNSSNFKSETIIVLPNITQDSSQYKQIENNNEYDFSINHITQKDIDANIKLYMSTISNEINEWLLNSGISEVQDKELRQVVINDLATDIIDRHKYVELNPSSNISETSELEHLKYQIFKLIYKLGIGDMTLVDHAVDLTRRIQNIPVPLFSMQNRKLDVGKIFPKPELGQSYEKLNIVEPSNLGTTSSRRLLSPDGKCCKRATCKRNINKQGISRSNSSRNISLREPRPSKQATTSTRRMSSPGKLASVDTEYNKITEPLQPLIKQSQTNTLFNQRSLSNIPHNKIRDEENNNNKNQPYVQTDLNEIHDAYDQYLKEWVQQIPLPTASDDDQMVATIARTDIYNSILETVSKLRSDPGSFNNRFLFEDILDDEIEKIFNNLPQTTELISKKHILKVKLIEKTSDINDLMKSMAGSYKQQLVENLRNNIPKPSSSETDNPDILEMYEELQILNLVEDFIICSHYQSHGPVITEAYRKKLVKRTENFVQELKANHNQALKNIDPKLYLENILDILKNIPLPSDETLQKEANEILLSIEIDKWYNDLPLIPNNDFVEQLHRKRLRNNLAKQILEMEQDNIVNLSNNSLKHEISQFLGKAPLRRDESLNINGMVDELVKRLKIRPSSIENDSKKVAFNDPNYDEFSRDVPLSSTYTEYPIKNMEIEDRSGMNGQSIQNSSQQQSNSGQYHNISVQDIPNYEVFNDNRPRSSSMQVDLEPHWYTLQESAQELKEPNISVNNKINHNKMEQSNKSIQVISPRGQTHNRHYYNIVKPLIDDMRSDSKCCNDGLAKDRPHNGIHPNTSLLNGSSEPNWYTLQESKENFSLSNDVRPRNESSHFVPYPVNTSQRLTDEKQFSRVEQYNRPAQQFVIPQPYLEIEDHDDYALQQKRDLSYQSRRNLPQRDGEIRSPEEDASRNSYNHTIPQKITNSYSPAASSPRRRESRRINQRSIGLDQVASPHRTPYHSTSPEELNRHVSHGPPNIIESQRRGSSQLNQSELFNRPTDQDGIRQTIERNKSIEAHLDTYNPEHLPGYYQPSVPITPRGHVPFKHRSKRGAYTTERNVGGRFEEDEESEDDNDEEEETHCRCVKKMLKNRKRYKYCPFEQYDGFPMCLTSPYFYPYFY